ncbi:MAG: hypothetical protein AVDCRST_MAG87-2946 [uncultured Thermomicrobiales bacterium]|uniref:Uncharacterized protein n=1 Tax=uncultured Thermomicrobiales bacterium TaxID=1645740 RepID=A0A6J4VE85_9BACT|nr:MAG: hypothetical protein AVDCRST_MAG87-2946 [uncultured Thermomicrobiales bacterium]
MDGGSWAMSRAVADDTVARTRRGERWRHHWKKPAITKTMSCLFVPHERPRLMFRHCVDLAACEYG